MWQSKLKEAGVSIHVMATGAGAGIQQALWAVPGSSAYLSGASFPYAAEEQEELLGFMPEHFCSEEAAIDLASAAYMKAYRFGGKKPVGVGVTASVTSEKDHRGEHRTFICIMTDEKVIVDSIHMKKATFDPDDHEFDERRDQREADGLRCDNKTMCDLSDVFRPDSSERFRKPLKDVTELAKARFWARPYFTADGKRYQKFLSTNHALMPGAYNPPHDGHFGMADAFESIYGGRVVFNITLNPPHKDELSVQDCLKRAKLLRGRDRFFTRDDPYYIDKARRSPHTPMLIGADALLRMFDPKWGLDQEATLTEFEKLGIKFYVGGREINGKFVSAQDALYTLPLFTPNTPEGTDSINGFRARWSNIVVEIDGRWDVSSTDLRNKLTQDTK